MGEAYERGQEFRKKIEGDEPIIQFVRVLLECPKIKDHLWLCGATNRTISYITLCAQRTNYRGFESETSRKFLKVVEGVPVTDLLETYGIVMDPGSEITEFEGQEQALTKLAQTLGLKNIEYDFFKHDQDTSCDHSLLVTYWCEQDDQDG